MKIGTIINMHKTKNNGPPRLRGLLVNSTGLQNLLGQLFQFQSKDMYSAYIMHASFFSDLSKLHVPASVSVSNYNYMKNYNL